MRSCSSPAWSRTWSSSSASGSKPSDRNIAIVASWSAITSTTSFVSPSSSADEHRPSRRARGRRRCRAAARIDDHANLADVARPPLERDDRAVADDLAVRRPRSW